MANKGTSGQHGPAAQSIRLSATEGANKGFSKNLNEKVSSFIKPTAKPTIMPTLKQPIPQPQPQNRVVIPLRPGETLEKQGTTPFLKQPQNTTEGGNNVAPDTPETQETEKEVTVNEAPQTKKTRDDYDNMTDAEKEAFNVDDADDDLKKFLEDQKQSEQSNNDRTAGEISKRQHDEDEREDDDDKFEIKEGDFIDFLMKEIVLASAAYVGKKVAGGANYLLYKSGSWVYHDVLGKGVDKTIQFGEDTYKAIKQRHKEIQENSGKYHIPLTVIEGASSEELSKLYKEHNKAIDEIMKKDVSGIALANMFKEVISNGELKNYSHPIWVDPETGKKINVEKDQYAKAAIAISKQIHENTKEMDLSPKQKENYFNNIANLVASEIIKGSTIQLNMNLFAENMATAQMIQDKLNGNQNPKTKEEYIVQYQAMYLALRKKIQQKEKLPENIKTEDDIVKFSEKALKEGYKHDGEQGHTNKSILTLQNTISKKDTDQYTPQTLSDYAASTGLSIMQKKLEDANHMVKSCEDAKSLHDRQRKTKPSQKQEPQQQPTGNKRGERE